ncbi:hypothetical protein CEXT_64721 [Caerostris extrusa]|uniref:Uncharacterized protein n=1 Tax=Caerostris extrusa TaxID=172846 RepID=A0AAV4RGM5_CAEEX|nr:hypothetical protein CEXT_64721 [Caerostris extrusa]
MQTCPSKGCHVHTSSANGYLQLYRQDYQRCQSAIRPLSERKELFDSLNSDCTRPEADAILKPNQLGLATGNEAPRCNQINPTSSQIPWPTTFRSSQNAPQKLRRCYRSVETGYFSLHKSTGDDPRPRDTSWFPFGQSDQREDREQLDYDGD